MSDLINTKKSRDLFFQGKGKRKTLTSGPASVRHIMPNGKSMSGAVHEGAVGPKGPRVGLNVLDDIRTTPWGIEDGRKHMTTIKGEGTRMTQYDNAPEIRDSKKGQKQTLDGHYSVDRVALQRLLNAKYESGARPNYYEDGPSKKKKKR